MAAGAALTPPARRRPPARAARGRARPARAGPLRRRHRAAAGMAHVAFVRSPHAYARRRRASASRRSCRPACSPSSRPTTSPAACKRYPKAAMDGMEVSDDQHPVLPDGEVRYVGPAGRGRSSPSRARWPRTSPSRSRSTTSRSTAVVDPRASDEALVRWTHAGGDVDGAFARAAHVVSGRYGMARVAAVPIEARGAVAARRPATPACSPCGARPRSTHRPLAQLAHILDRPPETIRVIVPDVGGAFGTKGNPRVGGRSSPRSPRSTSAAR